MALILSRTTAQLKSRPIVILYNNASKSNLSFSSASRKTNVWTAAAGVLGAGAVGFVYTLHQSTVKASTDVMQQHAPHYPWSHEGLLKSFDHASIRRGWEVYKQVCAACHSLKYLRYREMVGVCLTDAEARAEAAEAQIKDGPGEDGKMFLRPGKLSDSIPDPYENEILARAANNGALPPDLTFITLGRHNGENYVFSLLTGYTDKPAGVKLEEGQNFNRFFPDGALAMAQTLFNEAAEYSDGTPATASQMAKDVVTFLAWAGSPEHDTRKKMLVDVSLVLAAIGLPLWWYRRNMASALKNRKVLFRTKGGSAK